ncbi:MAG: MBL fold metallo-hydrolase [Actinomycetota bacterium]|jgi:glyoxylase-like metal-dependent hydrolase (beta-lactamase superfamily II)|nr:MBL fold metallo-hydrolase [Rubrobacter sp.]MDQ3238238.1 MBL fold metallo-hydrolase [Actinomycetota bacterium]MDQ3567455.1 MBL fold metallo-hydrolase [Actinomycetota bacterium]
MSEAAPPAENDKNADATTYLFEQFRVERGCLGYVVAEREGGVAAIVDPEVGMVEPMLDYVFEHALRLRYIVDTHTHADHFSGVRELKAKTVAKVVMHDKAPASCVDFRIEDGDRLWLDTLPLKFLHTPGHAKDLVSIVLPGKVLSADALLIGSCGRTDLPNGNPTRQYHTLYYTYRSLPDDLSVYPGHDYNDRTHSTLAEEKENNPKMLFASEEEFVEYMERENPAKLSPVHQLADALKANMA